MSKNHNLRYNYNDDMTIITPYNNRGILTGILNSNFKPEGDMSLNDIKDVDVLDPKPGEILQWNGSDWVNAQGIDGGVPPTDGSEQAPDEKDEKDQEDAKASENQNTQNNKQSTSLSVLPD